MKVGEAPTSYQNNAFFVLIINSLFFAMEMRFKPYATPELNYLNFLSNLFIIVTILGGIFSSINQQNNFPLVIMAVIICLNSYFLFSFVKGFIQIKLSFNKKMNFLSKTFGNFWISGQKTCFILLNIILKFYLLITIKF